MRLPVGQQTFFTATVELSLTQIIQRILHDAMPSELPTARDLFRTLQGLGVGEKEGLVLEDVSNAVELLVLEGKAVRVETERDTCYGWSLGREYDLNFSFGHGA